MNNSTSDFMEKKDLMCWGYGTEIIKTMQFWWVLKWV